NKASCWNSGCFLGAGVGVGQWKTSWLPPAFGKEVVLKGEDKFRSQYRLVWTKVSNCHLIEIDIREHEKLEGKKVPQYPCLWVNVSAIGKSAILYHTEETKEKNHQCSYIPENLEDYQEARRDVETIRVRFKERQNFPCYSDPDETEKSVLYRRLYTPQMLLKWLFWPTFMLTGGIFIIMMVKLNQSLSMLAAQR
uniref:Calcium-activated potassium channel subunit beta n=1 Tax=Vombatus ursinus TaxID=29139 RepID=A0A4X2JS95_VOMUR